MNLDQGWLGVNFAQELLNRPPESDKFSQMRTQRFGALILLDLADQNSEVNRMCPEKWPFPMRIWMVVEACKKLQIEVLDQAY